jgi:hypothetical protein
MYALPNGNPTLQWKPGHLCWYRYAACNGWTLASGLDEACVILAFVASVSPNSALLHTAGYFVSTMFMVQTSTWLKPINDGVSDLPFTIRT